MLRVEAERVFELVAEMKGDLRERLVTERWWLIWIITGLQIPISNGITQWLLWRNETRIWPYAMIWAVQVLLLPITIKLIHHRTGGQRTQRETFIWWIWITFLLAACAVAMTNTLLGLPLFFTAPIIPLLAAFAFSMMAMAVHRTFLLGAIFFFVVVILMILFPAIQFIIYGVAWFITLEILGLYFRPAQKAQRRTEAL